MRRSRLLLIQLLMFIGSAATAQDKIVLNVIYEFSYIRDLDNKEQAYNANMVLSLGKNSSRYCSEKLYSEHDKKALQEKERQKKLQNTSPKPLTVVSGGPLLIVNNHGAIINEEIIKDIPNQKLTLHAVLGFKTYKIETVVPKINWNIQNEKREIGGYTCQKATGSYGGRTYHAWFTPDLPFQDGPWKLSGLPGLILEARDENNEIGFTFKELSRNTDSDETTVSYLNSQYSVKTNLKAFNRAKAEFEVDPEAVMTALAPNATLTIKNIDDPHGQTVRKIRRYNPIELN